MNVRYVIISPVRNEEKFIEKTIQSVIKQTIKPAEWIIVNDGSNDRTKEIVEKNKKKYRWIKLIDRPDIGYRPGGGVVEAFYAGFNQIEDNNFDYIVKLDGDLSFDGNYFENIFNEFSKNQKLGIASGQEYYVRNGKMIREDAPIDHVRGPSKIYRKECFNQIGGLEKKLGWDIIDVVTARMKDWQTRTFLNYRIIHLRKTGARGAVTRGNIRHGYTSYITGYHPLYFILRCIYRLFHRPYLIGSMALFWGYVKPLILLSPKVVTKEFQRYYRKEQVGKLLSKKFWDPYKRMW